MRLWKVGDPGLKSANERQTELETSRPLLNSGVNPHSSEFTWHLSASYALVLKLLWVFGDLQVKLTLGHRVKCPHPSRKPQALYHESMPINTQRAHA